MTKQRDVNKVLSQKELDKKIANAFNNLTPEGKSKAIEYVKMVFIYEHFFTEKYFE